MTNKNPHAIVTGGANGIGRSIVAKFVKEGIRVLVIDIHAHALETVKTEEGKMVETLQLDLADSKQIQQKVQHFVETHFGSKVDILVNNAGLQFKEDLVSSSIEDWDRILNVNLKSYFVLCKVVSKYMKKAKYGRIVNISSIHSLQTEPSRAVYASSKGGVNALTRALAMELAPYNILVNAVAPGFIHTSTSIINGVDETTTDEFRTYYARKRIAMGRVGQPFEVANAVFFFSSEQCAYTTGQVLFVDGGVSARF